MKNMNIVRWEPFSFVDRSFWDMPDYFRLFSDWNIDADLYEQDNKIIAKVNVPGVDPNNIKIEVEDNLLSISFEQKEEKEEKNRNYYRREIRSGSFKKNIQLPSSVSKKNILAEFKNGVLEITMDKNNIEKPKKIEIKIKK